MRYKIHIRRRLRSSVDASAYRISGYVYKPYLWFFYQYIEGEYVYVQRSVDEAIAELTEVLLAICIRHQKKDEIEQELKCVLTRAKVNETNNILLKAWKLL